jgi:protein phosphatase
MIGRLRGFAGLRVVGDVHGEARAFDAACAGAEAEGLFVVQLGDLVDHGPDSAGVLRRAFAMLDAGRGLFLLGNHEHKLRRALLGASVRMAAEGLGATLAQLSAAPDGEALASRAIAEIARAPAWIRHGGRVFVHGGFHTHMLHARPPEDAGARRPEGALARALFGEPTGRSREDGFPERSHAWLDRIPPGITVYVGHETRSTDGRPALVTGRRGGRAVFVDTGAGKGGHLSWVDLRD